MHILPQKIPENTYKSSHFSISPRHIIQFRKPSFSFYTEIQASLPHLFLSHTAFAAEKAIANRANAGNNIKDTATCFAKRRQAPAYAVVTIMKKAVSPICAVPNFAKGAAALLCVVSNFVKGAVSHPCTVPNFSNEDVAARNAALYLKKRRLSVIFRRIGVAVSVQTHNNLRGDLKESPCRPL